MPNFIVHKVIRRRIYALLLGLNIITSLLRFYYFPGQMWYFHIALFILTFLVLIAFWELISFESKILERLLPLALVPGVRIVSQTLITFLVFYSGSMLFFYGFAEPFFNVKTPETLHTMTPVLILLTSIIFNLIYFGSYYFIEWKRNLIHGANLEKQQALVRYDTLKNQLNPHFLFNALTSLNSLIFENQQLASDFLQQLSKVYRYILKSKDKETVLLETEVKFVSHYIFLLKTRFEDAIHFKIDPREEDMERGVVPLLLQMLIEDAVKHNTISLTQPLDIHIYSDGHYLFVENSLNKKLNVESSNQMGMENLKSLYNYLTEIPLELEQTNTHFIVKVPLI